MHSAVRKEPSLSMQPRGFFKRLGILLTFMMLWMRLAVASTTNLDFVAFFKQAISSPPDVENFIVSQRVLGAPERLAELAGTQDKETLAQFAKQYVLEHFYRGARSGTNFFLTPLEYHTATNALDSYAYTVGRYGNTKYTLNKTTNENSIIYGIGTNAMTAGNNSLFTLVQQFLDMGLAEVRPDTVSWDGDTFNALAVWGEHRCGELELTNGLPKRLKVRGVKAGPIIKTIEYEYPNPSESKSGFPNKMVLSSHTDQGFRPVMEITICEVRLSSRPLTETYFAEAHFIRTNITHVTIYSNSTMFATDRSGRVVVAAQASPRNLTLHETKIRRWLIWCLLSLTAFAPIILWKHATKHKNN